MTPATQTAAQEVRVALGMTQRQLATIAGVDHTYLSRFERGQVTPSRHWLRRVNRALGRLVAQRYQETQR